MIINDRRTTAQQATHRWLTTATDRLMSGWGMATGGASKCAWAWETLAEAEAHISVLRRRGDMKYIRVNHAGRWRPKCAHLSIYVGRVC
jgi:hypothetical protein